MKNPLIEIEKRREYMYAEIDELKDIANMLSTKIDRIYFHVGMLFTGDLDVLVKYSTEEKPEPLKEKKQV